jgi:ketosteroid isomerase-like protein
MMTLKPTVELKVIRSLEAGEIAQVTGSWTLSGTAPDGTALNMSGYYADVLRLQRDGSWRFVLDNPLSTS